MQNFRNLEVWKKAHSLTLEIYKATRNFPKEELYGLVSQLRRGTSSIPANIAEGCGRGSGNDTSRFFQIALGSASEVEYHLMLSRDLEYLNDGDYNILFEEVVSIKRMLTVLLRKVRTT